MPALIEWQDASGNTIAVELDVTNTEAWETAAEITEHAVEEGANVADHIRPAGETLTLEGWVSNTPLVIPRVDPAGLTGSVRAATATVGGKSVTLSVLQFDLSVDRKKVVDELFRGIVGTGTLVTVTTTLRASVSDLGVTRYRVDRDANTGGVLALTLDFKKVRKVATARAAVPRPAQRRGQAARQRGAQPATTPTGARRTALQNGIDYIRGARGGS